MLPRWRLILQRELPDVLAALREQGALVVNPMSGMQAKHTGGRLDGDDRFDTVTGRRPMLESVLARIVQAEPAVRVRRGVTVRSLPTQTRSDGTPHVLGVLVDPGELIHADVVVDATGRRSTIPALLAQTRTPPVDHREGSGLVYLSRHFRATADGVPQPVGAFIQDYPDLTILTLPSDNRTWSVSLVIGSADRALRGLRELPAWSAALALFPVAAHWAAGEPISDITVMAGIEDRIRQYAPDGIPAVTGLLAVGDAWACTNPSLGRGTALGFAHACALRDLLRGASADPGELVREWDRVTRAELEPTYRRTVGFDRHRLRELDAHRRGSAYRTDDPAWNHTRALAAAASSNPGALRGLLDVTSLLATTEEVLARPGVAGEVDLTAQPRWLPGPERSELLAVAGA